MRRIKTSDDDGIHHVVPFRRGSRGLGGKTLYRGKFTIEGQVFLTPPRATRVEAFDDVREKMRQVEATTNPSSPTLAQALAMVREDSVCSGASAITVEGYDRIIKHLLRFWDGTRPLNEVTEATVKEFVRRARDDGYPADRGGKQMKRSVNSLRSKDLPMLSRCFVVTKTPDNPISEVKRWMGKGKKHNPKRFASFPEVLAIILRVRHEEVQWPAATHKYPDLSMRAWDADLMLLIALTAARAAEIARVRAEHFVLTPGQETVKFISHKAEEDKLLCIENYGVPAAHRLVAQAGPNGYIVPGDDDKARMVRVTKTCTGWQRRLREPLLTARSLRHSHCTHGQDWGIATSVMSAQMGHQNLGTTSRYTHSNPEAHRAAFNAFVDAAAAELGSSKMPEPSPV